ncbi:Protein disulfide-isomerase like 2-2 [Chytriomyces hyalinus]|nr:Protein disulfide-isomerase like 2-2 [Chytriomyces hyalinus]
MKDDTHTFAMCVAAVENPVTDTGDVLESLKNGQAKKHKMKTYILTALLLLFAQVCNTEKVKKCKPRHKVDGAATQDQGEDCAEPETYLDSASFSNYVGDGSGQWLIFFFTDWCQYCKKLDPHWKDVVAKVLEGSSASMGLARFDCTSGVNNAFCHANGISTYPTIRLYSNGAFIEKYTGQRDSEHILDYISYQVAIYNVQSSGNENSHRALPPMMPPALSAGRNVPPTSNVPSDVRMAPPVPPQPRPVPPHRSENGGNRPQPPVMNGLPSSSVRPQWSNYARASPSNSNQQQQQQLLEAEQARVESKHLQCTFPPKTILCGTSLGFSILFIIPFALYNLYKSMSLPRSKAPSDPWPYMIDAMASCLVVAACVRSGTMAAAYAEVAVYAAAGAHIALLGAGFGLRGAVLFVGFVILVLASMMPGGWVVDAAAYVAATVIFVNRYAAEKSKKDDSLPGGANSNSRGQNIPKAVFDLAALAIFARCCTSLVEVKEFGIVVYFIVLLLLHVFGRVLFSNSGLESAASGATKKVYD